MPRSSAPTRPAGPIPYTPGSSAAVLWEDRRLVLDVDTLTAGIPANPKLLDAWLDKGAAGPTARADAAVMAARLREQDVEEHASVFARDGQGRPCYEGRALKAALKEAANILAAKKDRIILDSAGALGIPNARARLAEHVFVTPKLVPIGVAPRVTERVIHVMTRQGPRDSIKRAEVADDVTLTVTLRRLRVGVFTWDHLATLLDYLCLGGIGADRSQGSGTLSAWHWQDSD